MIALLKEVWLTAKKALTTLSGVLISFTLQRPKKAKKLVLSYLPQQDLNGYSKPWLGGNGKNLCPPLTIGKGVNANTGALEDNAAKARTDYIPVDFATNSRYYISGLVSDLFYFTAAYNASKQFLGRTGATAASNASLTSASFTSGTPQGSGDIAYLIITQYEISGQPGTIDEVSTATTQLEAGSSATSYEPYENICAITGRNSDRTVVSGKNRFSFNAGTQFLSPATYVSAETTDNSVTLTATGTGGAQYMRIALNEVFDLAKSYALSFKAKKIVKGTNGRPWIQVVPQGSHDNSNWTSLTKLENQNPTQGTEYTFSGVYTGYEFYRFYIYNNTNTPVTVGEKTAYYDIQFEEGNTATEFEPTLSTEYDPNYGSTLYGGSYDIVSGKLADYYEVIDLGTKTWTRGTTGQTGHYRYYTILNGAQEPVASTEENPNSVCTGFALVDTTWNCKIGYTIAAETGYLHIYSAVHDGLTPGNFKTAMSGVKVYYRKVTPVVTSLTAVPVDLHEGENYISAQNANEVTVVYESEE